VTSGGTTFICTHCGAGNRVGATFTNLGVSNNGLVNFGVTCRRCGRLFDAAPVDGTYSTIGGRLQRLTGTVRHLATIDRNALNDLRLAIAAAKDADDADQAVRLLDSAQVTAPAGGWLSSQPNRVELWMVLTLLTTIIGIILMLRPAEHPSLTPDELNNLVTRVVQQVETNTPNTPSVTSSSPSAGVAPPDQARNSPCACNSGHKYKHCHGAPPGLSRARS
jgi:hypothetical protein